MADDNTASDPGAPPRDKATYQSLPREIRLEITRLALNLPETQLRDIPAEAFRVHVDGDGTTHECTWKWDFRMTLCLAFNRYHLTTEQHELFKTYIRLCRVSRQFYLDTKVEFFKEAHFRIVIRNDQDRRQMSESTKQLPEMGPMAENIQSLTISVPKRSTGWQVDPHWEARLFFTERGTGHHISVEVPGDAFKGGERKNDAGISTFSVGLTSKEAAKTIASIGGEILERCTMSEDTIREFLNATAKLQPEYEKPFFHCPKLDIIWHGMGRVNAESTAHRSAKAKTDEGNLKPWNGSTGFRMWRSPLE